MFLTQEELAQRWNMSPRTLERWRWEGIGLKYIKLKHLIRYRISDVEAYEKTMTVEHQNDNQ